MKKNDPPRILLLIDVYDWAFHTLARGIQKQLEGTFSVDISTRNENPHYSHYDLIHVFGFGPNNIDEKCLVLKGLYNTTRTMSHTTLNEFLEEALIGTNALTVPIKSMYDEVRACGITMPIYFALEGVDTQKFSLSQAPSGPLRVCWAGNTARATKRLRMIQKACKDLCELHIADGTLSEDEMVEFYQSMDIVLCASEIGEGCPRSLIEAASCGCFIVSFPVGVAPEVIQQETNGLLVKKETVAELRTALTWCIEHKDTVRGTRQSNHEYMRTTRDWSHIASQMSDIYQSMLPS